MKARQKGYRSEHELEQLLNKSGIKAKRIPMSGQCIERGDIQIKLGDDYYYIEAKAWARGFLEYGLLENSDFVFKRTISKKETKPWLVTMTFKTFLEMIK